jgi:hypothetical protein
MLDYVEGFALMVGVPLALFWALHLPLLLAGALSSSPAADPASGSSILAQLGAAFALLLLSAPFLLLGWSLHTGRPWSRHLMLVLAAVPLMGAAGAGVDGLGAPVVVPVVLVVASFCLLYLYRPVDDWYRLLGQRQAGEREARHARREARREHEQRRAQRRSETTGSGPG